MTKKLLILVLALLFSLLTIAPGMAQDRDHGLGGDDGDRDDIGRVVRARDGMPQLTLEQSTVRAGSEVGLHGSGFQSGETVQIQLDASASGMPTAGVGGSGRFNVKVSVPNTAGAGVHIVSVFGRGRTLVQVQLRVRPTVTPLTATPTATTVVVSPTATATLVPPTPVATATAPPATAVATLVPTTAATASPTPTSPAPTATATPASSFEAQVVVLTNQQRAANGVAPPLTANAALGRSAHNYAVVMAGLNCVEHTCGPVPNFADRITQAGYNPWITLGENVAGGQQTPAEVVAAWMASPGHRANILNSAFHDIGVGFATSSSGFSTYWVQDFGTQ
jgi:uncharacterized protein YkwD